MMNQAAADPRFAGGKLLDLENGLVARRIFSDLEIYKEEMQRVFHRCWLFLGHDSMVPRPGDFITTYMGDDPVIVWRDPRGQVHAFLNNCPHRGNKLCLYDRGRAVSFSCSYHGWTFASDGKLTGVPFLQEAYHGQLDVDCWGLIEVPKVVAAAGSSSGPGTARRRPWKSTWEISAGTSTPCSAMTGWRPCPAASATPSSATGSSSATTSPATAITCLPHMPRPSKSTLHDATTRFALATGSWFISRRRTALVL